MKVFISADIEGVTTTNRWQECDPTHSAYPLHAEQLTREVLAACQGAIAAGATEITVKDAHGPGCNIDPTRLPKEVTLVRGWSHCPDFMAEGIDTSFDAAMFVGYHSAAGRCGNPLSHTMSLKDTGITINGRLASEFMIYSWAVARYGVPTVFLAGDKMLCEDYADLHPGLITVPVKSGLGGVTYCRSVEATLPEIRLMSEQSLRRDLQAVQIALPASFEVTISYKEHAHAEKVAHFPDVRKVSDNVVSFIREDFYEVLRALLWMIY
ncbi:MAG: M55 family metallopeptidase [Clostridia bacterium]|nr:M55 family metallopeptidase [Clostridia bacterium]